MFFGGVMLMVSDGEGFAKSLVKFELNEKDLTLEEISLELKRGIDERNNDPAFKHMIHGNNIRIPFAYSDWPISFPGVDIWLLQYNAPTFDTLGISLNHYSDLNEFNGDYPNSSFWDFSERGVFVLTHQGSRGFYRSPRLAIFAFFKVMDNFRKD